MNHEKNHLLDELKAYKWNKFNLQSGYRSSKKSTALNEMMYEYYGPKRKPHIPKVPNKTRNVYPNSAVEPKIGTQVDKLYARVDEICQIGAI